MANKAIYVSDDDLRLFQPAQELAGGTLSAAIAAALRRYVEVEEGRQQGYDDVVVRVGPGSVANSVSPACCWPRWSRPATSATKPTGSTAPAPKYVVHLERSEAHVSTGPNAEKYRTGWRAWVGDRSANQSWTSIPADSSLRIVDNLDALRESSPPSSTSWSSTPVHEPTIEDLDI